MTRPTNDEIIDAMTKAGGAAFPSTADFGDGRKIVFSGMTLRDWFAGMALAEVPDPATESDAPATARLAYAIADAMLAERNKG